MQIGTSTEEDIQIIESTVYHDHDNNAESSDYLCDICKESISIPAKTVCFTHTEC